MGLQWTSFSGKNSAYVTSRLAVHERAKVLKNLMKYLDYRFFVFECRKCSAPLYSPFGLNRPLCTPVSPWETLKHRSFSSKSNSMKTFQIHTDFVFQYGKKSSLSQSFNKNQSTQLSHHTTLCKKVLNGCHFEWESTSFWSFLPFLMIGLLHLLTLI